MRLAVFVFGALLALSTAACGGTTEYSDSNNGGSAEDDNGQDDGGRTPAPDAGPTDTGGPGVDPPECSSDRDCPDFAWCADGECASNSGDRCVRGSCDPSWGGCRSDRDCDGGSCEDGECYDNGNVYRFVLLEDLTPQLAGEFPGADIDAIELEKSNGASYFVSAIEDAYVGSEHNLAMDPNQLVGPPDSNCEADSGAFTSLGGAPQGGYAIVSYGTAQEDVTIQNGDRIRVYELGISNCGQFDDDHVEVSVGVGNTLGWFYEQGVVLGRTSGGSYTIQVSGL